mmetsp:Transcript_3802/g.12301  ORF Transcript_3802/g.12301 Transcript_3802/m.12301 type:complete len:277 (-) Transcript_3802:913-1743(-)
MHDLVALPDKLVRPDYEADVLAPAERRGHVGPKLHDARAQPPLLVGMHAHVHPVVRVGGVGPEGVQHAACDLPPQGPLHPLQVLEAPTAVADAAVQDQHYAADEGGEGQPIECIVQHLIAEPPPVGELLLHVVEEAILRHAFAHASELVIASDEEHLRGIDGLQGEEQEHNLQLVLAPVHPVAVEDVGHTLDVTPAVRGRAIEAKHEQEVSQLPVDVPEDLRRCVHAHDGRLGRKPLLAPLREQLDARRLVRLVLAQEYAQSGTSRQPVAVEDVCL